MVTDLQMCYSHISRGYIGYRCMCYIDISCDNWLQMCYSHSCRRVTATPLVAIGYSCVTATSLVTIDCIHVQQPHLSWYWLEMWYSHISRGYWLQMWYSHISRGYWLQLCYSHIYRGYWLQICNYNFCRGYWIFVSPEQDASLPWDGCICARFIWSISSTQI